MRLDYTPPKVKLYRASASTKKYTQKFKIDVDGIYYIISFYFRADKIYIQCSFLNKNINSTIINTHTSEKHIIKMFLSVNYLIGFYIKNNLLRCSNVDIKEIIFIPALDVSDKEIVLQRRNKMYIKAISEFILNDLFSYENSYDKNNIIFKNIKNIKTKENFKLYNI